MEPSLDVPYQALFRKKAIKMIGERARLRDAMGQSNTDPFMPILVLTTYVIHRSTLHYAVAGCLFERQNLFCKRAGTAGVNGINTLT